MITTSRLLALALLGGVATTGIAGIEAAAPPASNLDSKAFELLNPAALAKGICATAPARAPAISRVRLAAADPAAGISSEPSLMALGERSFPITTETPEAQAYFDQGMKLLYAFNHYEAARAFGHARSLDPACAMCSWGEAQALGATINTPMAPGTEADAREAAAEALALSANASPKEKALILAVARRFGAVSDGSAIGEEAYAEAMSDAHEHFPDDDDVAVLFAESLMNLQPWDYWERDGRTPKKNAGEVLAVLEQVLARNGQHPQAIHLYIHMTEASHAPERAAPYADRLGELMPAAGHIVHMPSHTYFRIGRYRDSLEANIAAMAADQAYLAQAREAGFYAHTYYPHNVHFAMTSAQMAGDGKHALQAAKLMPETLSDEITAQVPWVQPIMASPYFAYAQFADAAEVLALPAPGHGFPLVRAMWHYARGVAHARAGDAAKAEQEKEAIARLQEDPALAELEAAGVSAPAMLEIASAVIDGRLAQAAGDHEGAVEAFTHAVEVQDELIYMEPPFWYYPARQSLGAALLAAGQPEKAVRVFTESLVEAPNNGWALWGLVQAQRQAGDELGAAAAERFLAATWVGPREILTLDRL
jgi:tetratricopeptide (TPR) repeat protein